MGFVRTVAKMVPWVVAAIIGWTEYRLRSGQSAAPIEHAPGADRPVRKAPDRAVPDGSIAGDGTTTCPPDFPIKGNSTSSIYHAPGTASFERTIADFCFATSETAEAAGFRAPKH